MTRLCLDCERIYDGGECARCYSPDPAYSIEWTDDDIGRCRDLCDESSPARARHKAEMYVAKKAAAARDCWCDDCGAITDRQLTGFAEYYGTKETGCAPCAKRMAEDDPSDDEICNGVGVEGGISCAVQR